MEGLLELAMIGKFVLIQSVGVQPNFKSVSNIPLINETRCHEVECPIYKLKKMLKRQSQTSLNPSAKHDELESLEKNECLWNCPNKAVNLSPSIKYENESNQYNLYKKSERLSNLQLKQLLLYHFYLIENNGIIRGLSVSKVAEILKCSTKTVKNNNLRLVNDYYIWVTTVDKDRFDIYLRGYKNYHLTAREGGSGYLYMSLELLKELLSISNVNVLRLEIRKLLAYDNKNIGSDKVKPARFTYEDIKRVLPRYFSYKSIIDKVLQEKSSAFTVERFEDGVEFVLNKRYDTDSTINRKSSEYMEKFEELLSRHGVEIDDNYKGDLIQMSFQYGFKTVYDATNTLIDTYSGKGKDVVNFGGLVRTIIRKNLKYQYAI